MAKLRTSPRVPPVQTRKAQKRTGMPDQVNEASLKQAVHDGWQLLTDADAIKERYRYGDGINAPRCIMTFDLGVLLTKIIELEETLAMFRAQG